MTDQKVIALIQSNKSDMALAALYQYYPMMQKMIVANGGNSKDAEDIFQEALIVLYRKATHPGFELTAKLSTYLFSICRYLWKDELKKQKRVVPTDFSTTLSEQEENDLHKITAKEQVAVLAEKVLDGLGERCKELLLLFYSGGRRLKDIAIKMGYSSEQTAKNQKYKCLEGAKNRLKELKQLI